MVAFNFEIRQFPILPSGVPLSTFGVNELNFCVRNGNRWILVAIITGMAPLVGLEATPAVQKHLILRHFRLKTGQNEAFSSKNNFMRQSCDSPQNDPETVKKIQQILIKNQRSCRKNRSILNSKNGCGKQCFPHP